MAKRKPTKMSTGEAVKILANESKQIKQQILVMFENMQKIDMIVRDYAALFERYIEHTEDGAEFVEKMKALVEENVNAEKENGKTNDKDSKGDKQDKKVGAK